MVKQQPRRALTALLCLVAVFAVANASSSIEESSLVPVGTGRKLLGTAAVSKVASQDQWGWSGSSAQAQAQAQSSGRAAQAQAQAQAQSGGGGSQAQAQAQAQSLSGGWYGGGVASAQAQAQAQSYGGGWYNPYGGYGGGHWPYGGGWGGNGWGGNGWGRRSWYGKKLLTVMTGSADSATTAASIALASDGSAGAASTRKLQ